MEILFRGQLPELKVYEATCTHCETVISFVRSEALYRSDQRDGDYLIIKCPVCSNSIYKSI